MVLTAPVAIVSTKVKEAEEITPIIGSYPCVKCGIKEAPVEMGRCPGCSMEHQRLVKTLDSRPRQVVEKAPRDDVEYKTVRNGVVVTYKISREEARILGRNIN